MGVVNRRSGMAFGSSKIWQLMAAFGWKGLQVVRNFGTGIQVLPTISAKDVRSKIVEFTERWHTTLTADQRNMWDQYAASLGSAVDREQSDNVSNAKNIIHRHRKLMSGINAYIATNITAHLATIATPLDIAPLGAATPAPPSTVGVTYTAPGPANVTWTDPVLSGTPAAKFVRLWARVYSKGSHAQLVKHIALPGGSTSFTDIRTGHSHGSPQIPLLSIKGPVILRVQMDTIVQRNAGEGTVIGPGSNVAEATIVNP